MVLCEFLQVLVKVEDNSDGDDQGDGEEIVAQKLLDNVPVELLDVPERVEKPEYAQEPELVSQPAHSPDEPPELSGSPSAAAVEPAVFSYLLKIFHYAFLLKFFGQAGR